MSREEVLDVLRDLLRDYEAAWDLVIIEERVLEGGPVFPISPEVRREYCCGCAGESPDDLTPLLSCAYCRARGILNEEVTS